MANNNKHVRDARSTVEAMGARVVEVREGGRHTELHVEGNGHAGIIRLHRGTTIKSTRVASVRSQVRKILQGRPGGVAPQSVDLRSARARCPSTSQG